MRLRKPEFFRKRIIEIVRYGADHLADSILFLPAAKPLEVDAALTLVRMTSTTGLPLRVIVTCSPLSTARTRAGSWFFASLIEKCFIQHL